MPLVDERDERGPFSMRHGYLHSENILVDSTAHIVGVLDWDCTATVRWEAFVVLRGVWTFHRTYRRFFEFLTRV